MNLYNVSTLFNIAPPVYIWDDYLVVIKHLLLDVLKRCSQTGLSFVKKILMQLK